MTVFVNQQMDNMYMEVYSEHCTQHIVTNNKTQYKLTNLTTILQSIMFERDKF